MSLDEYLRALGATDISFADASELPEKMTLSDFDGQDIASFRFDDSMWILSARRVKGVHVVEVNGQRYLKEDA